MGGKYASVKVGLLYVPFGLLLGWIGMLGIIGLILSCLFAYAIGDVITRIARIIFIRGTRNLEVQVSTINEVLVKNAMYMIPLIIIAFTARILFGWVTIMPFAATAAITHMSATTAEMAGLGMKGKITSMAPSLFASGMTMAWTIGFSVLF